MKTIHQKIKELQRRNAGTYWQSSFDHLGKSLDYRIKLDEERMVRGYLAVFNEADDRGTAPIKGAFAKSLNERGPKSNAKQKILFLWYHKMDQPIGQFIELEEDNYGLRFAAVVDDIPEGERVLRQIRSGTINQFSYGFLPVWDKMEYDEEKDIVRMLEVDLWEGSAVTYGSQKQTFAIRSKEQLTAQIEDVQDELEEFISNMPRAKQMEFRQLLTRYKSLMEVEPDSIKETLKKDEPTGHLVVGNYKLDVKQFKN